MNVTQASHERAIAVLSGKPFDPQNLAIDPQLLVDEEDACM
jgi:hypothetical protein